MTNGLEPGGSVCLNMKKTAQFACGSHMLLAPRTVDVCDDVVSLRAVGSKPEGSCILR
jgi:hypothetical protein